MGIELESAKKTFEIIERLKSEPKLILTEKLPDNYLLYNVQIDKKDIFDYLKEYLYNLKVFSECKIQNNNERFLICIEPLRFGEYTKYINDDKVVKIDVIKHTYKIINKSIEEYEMIMRKNYQLNLKELDNYWEKFINLTFKKRILNAIKSLVTRKKMHIRLLDFVFWLSVSKKKVEKALDRECKKIKEINDNRVNEYNKNINEQKYYLQYAPEHIQKIKSKQKEIVEFLISNGYHEDNEMSDYIS